MANKQANQPSAAPVIYRRDISGDEALRAQHAGLVAEFAQAFGQARAKDIDKQVTRVVADSVRQTSMSKAVFSEKQIINNALRIAQRKDEFPEAVLDHPRLRQLIEQAVQEYPFVVIGATGTFTTESNLRKERDMVALAGAESGQHVLDEQTVLNAIATKDGISEEQIAAVIAATRSNRDVSMIEGSAGAGKTYTAEAICMAYQNSGYDVKGTAVSWVAARLLGDSTKIADSRSLAKILYEMGAKFKRGAEYFHRPTVLMVDEAGMVGTDQMSDLLHYCAASRYPVKVILMGDTLQVIPIAAGAAMETLVAYYGSARIDTIRRQAQHSHRTAIHQLSRRASGAAIHAFQQQEVFHWAATHEDQVAMVVRDYVSYRRKFPDRAALILAADNETVGEINRRIRAVYQRLGQIQQDEVTVRVTDTRKVFDAPFSVGDQIVLRGNNPGMPIYDIDPSDDPLNEKSWKLQERTGVFNRNLGTIVGIRKSRDPLGSWDFIVDLGGKSPGRVVVNSETFQKTDGDRPRALPMVHNYATTVYASQGSTVPRVFVLDSTGLDFRTAYVGCSRHTDQLSVYLDETDLHNRLDRLQGKRRARSEEGLPIQRGRYTRREMLQEVSMNWARDSQNPTALLYERRARLGQNPSSRDIETLARVAPASRVQDETVWDQDLVATIEGHVDNALAAAEAWSLGRDLDAGFLCSGTKALADICRWLGDTRNLEIAEAQADSMAKRRPAGGIWPITDAEDLAAGLARAATGIKQALIARPALAQEILDRTRAGDAFSAEMKNVVRIMDERVEEVDVSRILDMDHPLEDAPVVSGTEVDEVRLRTDLNEIPTDPSSRGSASVAAETAPPQGVLGRLFSGLRTGGKPSDPAPASPRERRSRTHWRDPFTAETTATTEPEPETGTGAPKGQYRAPDVWLRQGPTPDKRVPMMPFVPPAGVILAGGHLDFEGVPQTELPDDRRKGPSVAFTDSAYGAWWTRGLDDEPRILARSRAGDIQSRYALDGRLVAGNGYPPMALNPKGTAQTPIWIVAGAREMVWMMEHTHAKYGDTEKRPHIVWAARECDLGLVAKGFSSAKEVVIVRSRVDERQAAWAADLSADLKTRFRVMASVMPPLPQSVQGLRETSAAPRPRVRQGP